MQQRCDTQVRIRQSRFCPPPQLRTAEKCATNARLAACGNLWAGLAARDPWRFVNNPITDAQGKLLHAWRTLLLRYPDRFMVGSDTVWPVDQLDRWDEADTGWQELGRFWAWHRSWLEQLPDGVARRIGCENAVKLFRAAEPRLCQATVTGRE